MSMKTLLAILAFGFFLIPQTSFAVVAEQLIVSSEQNSSSTGYIQQLGSGLSGLVTGLSVRFQVNNTASENSYGLTLNRCSGGYGVGCSVYWNGGTIVAEVGGAGIPMATYSISTSSPFFLDPAYYYYFTVAPLEASDVGKVRVAGSSSNVYSKGACLDNSGTPLATVLDCYFVLSGTNFSGWSTVSTLYNLTPVSGMVTASTTVATSFSYTKGDDNPSAYRLLIRNLSTGVAISATSTLPADFGTVNASFALASGAQYSYSVCFVDDGVLTSNCASTLFSVLSNPNPFSGLTFSSTTVPYSIFSTSTLNSGLSFAISTTTGAEFCAQQFSPQSGDIIGATLSAIPYALCRFYSWFDSITNVGAEAFANVPNTLLSVPPFSAINSVITALDSFDQR